MVQIHGVKGKISIYNFSRCRLLGYTRLRWLLSSVTVRCPFSGSNTHTDKMLIV